MKQTSKILGSAVATNVLNLEQVQAQYIYIDDPRYKGSFSRLYLSSQALNEKNKHFFFHIDIFMFRHDTDLKSSVSERSTSLTYGIKKWWRSLNRGLALKLLNMAKSESRDERIKATKSLASLKYLKGKRDKNCNCEKESALPINSLNL